MNRQTEHEIAMSTEYFRNNVITAFDLPNPSKELDFAIKAIREHLHDVLQGYLRERRRRKA